MPQRLQLHGVALVAIVRLRVRVEALAGLLAKPPLRDEAAQEARRLEALPLRAREPLELLVDGVESFEIGLHQRREDAAPRVHPSARHHPEVELAHRRHAVLEEQACLDQRLQDEPLGEVRRRVGVAVDLRLAVLVEAVAARLRAELALLHQTPHALVDVEALAVARVQVLGDVEHRVEPQHVAEDERPHRSRVRGRDPLVDLADRQAVLLLRPPDLADG